MKEHSCVGCGHPLDACTGTGGEKVNPIKGDISVCAYCGQIGVVNGEGDIVPIPEDILQSLRHTQPEDYKRLMTIKRAISERVKMN